MVVLVVEDSKAEVIDIWNIDPVVKMRESGGVLRPSRMGGVQQVTLCDGVSSKSCEDVFVELFYVH